MEFIKKNRSAAAIILVAVVVLSVFLGSFRSVSELESTVDREFSKKDRFGETVSSTVDMLSRHISTFVMGYKASLGDCAEINILLECTEQLIESDNGISHAKVDIDAVRNAATLMHQRLDASDNYLPEAKAAFAGIDNDISILKKYDGYNAAAKKYNDASESFVGKLFGMGKAIEF